MKNIFTIKELHILWEEYLLYRKDIGQRFVSFPNWLVKGQNNFIKMQGL